MRDEIHDVEPRNVLQTEEINGLRLLFTEDGDQHVAARDFLLAARLHVEYGALQDPLETERRLHVGFVIVSQQGRLLVDAFHELAPQFDDVGITGLENLVDLRDVEQCQQQVFDGHELMTALTGPLKGLVQTEFKFTTEHASPLRTLPWCTAAGAGAAWRYS